MRGAGSSLWMIHCLRGMYRCMPYAASGHYCLHPLVVGGVGCLTQVPCHTYLPQWRVPMSDDTSAPRDEVPGLRTRGASKILGANGERFAATWLEALGYTIVERNWRCPYGELDVIARSGGEWVFFEVKTRRGRGMGAPEEAVTRT